MVRSMLQDYLEGGWLPMWKNIVGECSWYPYVYILECSLMCCVETNIMVPCQLFIHCFH